MLIIVYKKFDTVSCTLRYRDKISNDPKSASTLIGYFIDLDT